MQDETTVNGASQTDGATQKSIARPEVVAMLDAPAHDGAEKPKTDHVGRQLHELAEPAGEPPTFPESPASAAMNEDSC